MVIKEIKSGNAIIRFHDDCIKSKEESELILQRAMNNALRHIIAEAKEKTA